MLRCPGHRINAVAQLFKSILTALRPLAILFDILLWPVSVAAVVWFRVARYWGVKRLPLMRATFLRMGMFPIVRHYYDPLFDYKEAAARKLPTPLSLDGQAQLSVLRKFHYTEEWASLPMEPQPGNPPRYHYRNGAFEFLDAECYYGVIRQLKPARILEVGSGFSTLLAMEAIRKCREDDSTFRCDITCIEPYERPFLESLDIRLIRAKVEDVPVSHFESLNSGDILFVDSSHVIRPGGDVLHLILGVLPLLKRGVWVHFHDIFLPNAYPSAWLSNEFRLWNEQYLLEAYLAGNRDYEVVIALNYLSKQYGSELGSIFPNFEKYPGIAPGSFWIRKL